MHVLKERTVQQDWMSLSPWLRCKLDMNKKKTPAKVCVCGEKGPTKSITIALLAGETPNNQPLFISSQCYGIVAMMWGNMSDIQKSSVFTTAGNSAVGCKTNWTDGFPSPRCSKTECCISVRVSIKTSSQLHVCVSRDRSELLAISCGFKKEPKNEEWYRTRRRQMRTPSPLVRSFMQCKSNTRFKHEADQ